MATAPTLPSALVCSTYRALRKTALSFDRSPFKRAHTSCAPLQAYHRGLNQWINVPLRNMDGGSRVIDEFVRKANKRVLYLPPVPGSHTAAVSRSSATARGGDFCRQLRHEFETRPATMSSLSDAFAAIKMNALEEGFWTRLPRVPPTPPRLPAGAEFDVSKLRLTEDTAAAFAADPATTARLVLAHPVLPDMFFHAVVLMVEGDAMGVIINQPVRAGSRRELNTVSQCFPPEAHPIFKSVLCDNIVFCGGPVGVPGDRVSALVLHGLAGVPLATPVAPGVWLSYGEPSLDALMKAMQDHPEYPRDRALVLVGYSGWGPGQLAGEIEQGSWIVATREHTPAAADASEAECAAAASDLEDVQRLIFGGHLVARETAESEKMTGSPRSAAEDLVTDPTAQWCRLFGSFGDDHLDLTRLALPGLEMNRHPEEECAAWAARHSAEDGEDDE